MNALTAVSLSAPILIFLIPACAVPLAASAQSQQQTGNTYYVDNSIADRFKASAEPDCSTYNPTTFQCGGGNSLAYATIADINTLSFKPGDTILFRRGEIWREQLTDPSGTSGCSGSAAAPITFGAFGNSGLPLPIISGANLLANWASDVVSKGTSVATVYSSRFEVIDGCLTDVCVKPYAVTPNQVFEDGHRLARNASGYSSLLPGQWYLDATNDLIWVRLIADDQPTEHTIEASQRDFGIEIYLQSNITISHIETEDANESGIGLNAGYGNGAEKTPVGSGRQVIGVVSIDNFSDGISTFWSGNDVVLSSTVAYNGRMGIWAMYAQDLLIDENTAHDNVQLFVQSGNAGPTCAGIKVDGIGEGDIVQRNLVYSNGTAGNLVFGRGIAFDTGGGGDIVRYNKVYSNSSYGIELDATNNATIFDNVIFDNGSYGIYAQPDALPVLEGDNVISNTLYGNKVDGILILGNNPEGGCRNNVVVNNISMGTIGTNVDAIGGCQNFGDNGSGNLYMYNAFGVQSHGFISWGQLSSDGGGRFSTYAAWESAKDNCGKPGCSHSMESDPLFSDISSGDFTLSSSSPAIGAGANLGPAFRNLLDPMSTWPFNVILDTQSSSTQGWAIGAYSAAVTKGK